MNRSRKVTVFSFLKHQLFGEMKVLLLSFTAAEFPLHAADSVLATGWNSQVPF